MSLGEGSKVGLCVLCLLGCLLDECGICGLSSSEPRRSRLGYHGISMVGGGFCYHGVANYQERTRPSGTSVWGPGL
jgi:hypothetical protein